MKNLRFFIFLSVLTILLSPATSQGQVPIACDPVGSIIPSESCQSACITCNFQGTYSGTTAGWAGDATPPGWCSQIQNDQWFAFVAAVSSATITIVPSNCATGNGIQAAVYADCDSNPLACDAGCAGCVTPINLTVQLTPGQTYYLVIDGFSQDECDFDMSVSPANAFIAPPVGPTGNIIGQSTVCPGATLPYSVPAVSGAGYYTWNSSTPGVFFNGQPGPLTLEAPLGRNVDVTFPNGVVGNTSISVTPSNICSQGTERTKIIQSVPVPPTILPKQVVCYENLPYTLPWGQEAYFSGVYTGYFTTTTGCDSVVRQTVIALPYIFSASSKYICKGDSITVCDTTFYNTGNYTQLCVSYQGCDSLSTVNLFVLDPVAQITGNTVIGCQMNSITLHSAPSSNFPGVSIKTWTRPDGSTSVGETLEGVTETGLYRLCTGMTAGGLTCETCDSVQVTRDSLFIPITTVSGILGCNTNTTFISCTTAVSNPIYQWIGPNGFTSMSQSPAVSNVGTYTVVVATATGCVGTATATVTQVGTQPQLATTGATITCAAPVVAISASSTTPNVGFLWSGPGGFQSNLPNPTVTAPGLYRVTITASSGCTNSATVMVSINNIPPAITGITVNTVGCSAPATLAAFTSTNTSFLWSSPNGATYTTQSFTTETPGVYALTVTGDVNGCTSTGTTTVFPFETPSITTVSVVQPTQGLPNGSIDVSVNLQPGTYTFIWQKNGVPFNNNGNLDLTMLGIGNYTLVVNTNPNCSVSSNYILYNTNPSGGFVCNNNIPYAPAESCMEVVCAACDLNNYQGSTAGWAADLPPMSFCSQIQNDQWHAFIAGSDTAVITVTSANCINGDGVQFAVYPFICESNPIACNTGCSGCMGSSSLSVQNLIPGQIYYLVIDGFSIDECDYTITASPSHALAAIPLGTPAPIQGPTTICNNNTYTYTLSATAGATSYVWTSSTAGVLLNGQNAPVITTTPNIAVTIPANTTDSVSICVKSQNSCSTSPEQCLTVQVQPSVTTVLPTVVLCSSDLPYTTPWGQSITTAGIYTFTLTAANGCDSIVQLEMIELNPVAQITGNNIIGCGMTTVTLSSVPSLGAIKIWRNLNTGQVIGMGNELITGIPGEIVLTSVVTHNGVSCSASDTISIVLDNSTLVVNAAGGVLGCTSNTLTLQANAAGSNLQYLWTGPNGFGSTEQNPIATAGGIYTVSVTDPINGCSGTATATVLVSQGPPQITLNALVLTCNNPTAALNANVGIADATYNWSGPGGFQSTEPQPIISTPGLYAVTVSDALGCTNTGSTTVLEDIMIVEPVVTGITVTCIGAVELIAEANTNNVSFVWTDPLGNMIPGNNVIVTMSGTYSLVTTNTNNGCTTVGFFPVIHSNTPPVSIVGEITNPTGNQNNGSINITTIGGLPPYTYSWSLNGVVFANTEDVSNLAPGEYTLEVTDASNCSAVAVFVLIAVGTDETLLEKQLTIQPNPNNGQFTLINKDNASHIEQLLVYDAIGRLVWFPTNIDYTGNQSIAIDLGDIATGVYLLEVILDNGERIVKKVVVK